MSVSDTLAETCNLRDLGGPAIDGGRRVRHGVAYRSAAPGILAGEDLAVLRELGIRTIVDLRHNDERDRRPTPWQALGCVDYWSRDHTDSGADIGRRARDPALTAESARAAMVDLYRELPYAQADSYARLFRAIAAGEGPVLFHCAVGKDRTGVAAALLLAAVGVARTAIVDDYLATASFDLGRAIGGPDWAAAMPAMSAPPQAIVAALTAVDPAYLAAMFEAVDARSGGVPSYLRDTLGLDDAALAALTERLVTTA